MNRSHLFQTEICNNVSLKVLSYDQFKISLLNKTTNFLMCVCVRECVRVYIKEEKS